MEPPKVSHNSFEDNFKPIESVKIPILEPPKVSHNSFENDFMPIEIVKIPPLRSIKVAAKYAMLNFKQKQLLAVRTI